MCDTDTLFNASAARAQKIRAEELRMMNVAESAKRQAGIEARREYAANELSGLIQRDIGVAIPPAKLENMIRRYWGRVSKLAHLIHGDSE